MNRIRAGYCIVKNPFNPNQESRIPLSPEETECIVFWTRDASPIFPYLTELNDRGFRYYFLYTLVDYPASLEPASLSIDVNITRFIDLAELIGPDKVLWRYDPILISSSCDFSYHFHRLEYIASRLKDACNRCIISFYDPYPKTVRRTERLPEDERPLVPEDAPGFSDFIRSILETLEHCSMEVQTCVDEIAADGCEIPRGKCIDDALIRGLFDIRVSSAKDPGQRKGCRCVRSRDIGAYDTCPRGCIYCYATGSQEKAAGYFGSHDPECAFLG